MPAMSDTKHNISAAEECLKQAQNVNGVKIYYSENTMTGQLLDFKSRQIFK